MHEEQLWWPIGLLFFGLLLVESGEVPDHHPAVVAGGCQEVRLHTRESNIIDVLGVRPQAEELGLNVSHVPNGDGGVRRPSQHQKLVKWRAVNAHDLLHVPLNGIGRPLGVPGIPDLELLIVSHGRKDVLIKVVPSNILHYRAVGRIEAYQWLLSDLIRVGGIDIPDAGPAVVGPRQ